MKNAVTMMHLLLEPHIHAASVLVDMTCGNGYDTLFLADRAAPSARIYAFDIQQAAIEATRQRLARNGIAPSRVQLRQGSHDELLAELTDTPDIIIFNLGYLPNGNHAIHTECATTAAAIKIGLNKVPKNGIIMIATYPGTPDGTAENQTVYDLLCSVEQAAYDVSLWQPINQIHRPPLLYLVQKRGYA
ncbi:tRNA (mnm(5)s(2)U34)-methyltransferase [Megasphaera vaginalis (ex Srinivasan et al. 2021)]|uniref:Putative rRNA methylase n=1 Tax=Megasphaera vaginalis (ex Srinivasan et al. 2021) TaxID=1111454 RepID=U7UB62_9FIRM|nr:class I SAM-dependent methyltransferase [Megasphaera vaginalis (ex Srinivasan et al. 2021)]ERT56647.1 putative rRNA methylase [Megasphaera vaginalis (ex Srinivasan et al. 2021)]